MTSSTLLGPLLLTLAATGPTPEPSPTTEHTIYTVTPGISGFIAFFVFALVGWLLFRSLVKHVRRVDQAKLQRERAAEEEAAGAAEPDGAQATTGPADGVASDDETGEDTVR